MNSHCAVRIYARCVNACIDWMSAKSSTAHIATSLTPQNPQENHTGQHFWPNLFLGRWLKGLAFQKFKKSMSYCARQSLVKGEVM